MRDFRQLNVWEDSHRLTLDIYKATKDFPKEELFALTSQIRRAGYSVPSNIAEGCGRSTNKDFARFLQIALGSLYELDYHLLLAKDLKYLETEVYRNLEERVVKLKKQLTVFTQKILSDC